jgi:hypothetical protein
MTDLGIPQQLAQPDHYPVFLFWPEEVKQLSFSSVAPGNR